MAIAVASTSSATFTSSSPIVVTKPSGLAVGDLMIAHFGSSLASLGAYSMTIPSGWAVLPGTTNSQNTLIYKFADSTDVSAIDFSFSFGTFPGLVVAGGILRVTGAYIPINGTGAEDQALSTTNPVFTDSITPPVSDCLIIFTGTGDFTNGGVSNYAIATSNPTWTEAWQHTATTGSGVTIFLAYAIRSASTATGDSSVTCADSGDWFGQLASVAPNYGPLFLYKWNSPIKSAMSTMNGVSIANIDKWNDVT